MTSESLRCPACAAPMQAAPLSTFRVLTCGACGGVWADSSASSRIHTVLDRELVQVAKDAAMRAAESKPHLPHDAPRACPVCAVRLTPVKRARVTLDVCSAHGTWFDRDELGRVSRNLEYERKSSEPAEAPYRVASIPAESTPPSSALDVLHDLMGD